MECRWHLLKDKNRPDVTKYAAHYWYEMNDDKISGLQDSKTLISKQDPIYAEKLNKGGFKMVFNQTWTHKVDFWFDTSLLQDDMKFEKQMLTKYVGKKPEDSHINSMSDFYDLTLGKDTYTIWATEEEHTTGYNYFQPIEFSMTTKTRIEVDRDPDV